MGFETWASGILWAVEERKRASAAHCRSRIVRGPEIDRSLARAVRRAKRRGLSLPEVKRAVERAYGR